MSKKIVFMGTPNYAKVVLEGLVSKGYEIVLVVTQPDKKVGRKQEIKFSQVKEYALENNLEIFQPLKVRTDFDKITQLKPDLIITAAYGQIIPKEVLDCAKFGCVNLHGSILPKYRGGAPIQWSIMNGDKKTGVTLMYMDEKMDTGNIIKIQEIDILINDNLQTVFDKMSLCARDVMLDNIESIFNGTNKSEAQDETLATYAWNIKKDDEFIDTLNWDSLKIHNHTRGLYPFIVGNIIVDDIKYKLHETELSDLSWDENYKVNKFYVIEKEVYLATKDKKLLKIKTIQKIGKKPISSKDFANQIK